MTWNCVCWYILTTCRTDYLWSWYIVFTHFGTNLTLWNGSNFRFPGISFRTHIENSLKFYMLMYLNHPQNWFVYDQSLLILLILALFDSVKRVKFWVSGHFPENALREWPQIVYADVPWPLLCSVDFFSNLTLVWLSKMGQILGYRAFTEEHRGGEWPAILYTVSWAASKLFRLRSQSSDFLILVLF